MTENVKRALMILRNSPMTAGEFGTAMWPDRTGRICSASGGGDYAAQMLLGRLRRQGYVATIIGPGATRWELTARGRRDVPDEDTSWRTNLCRKCKASLMRWWRYCPSCGNDIPRGQE